jgi:hypothetical protein
MSDLFTTFESIEHLKNLILEVERLQNIEKDFSYLKARVNSLESFIKTSNLQEEFTKFDNEYFPF